MIYRAPQLDPDESALVDAIDAIVFRVANSVLVPPRWQGETYREIFVRSLEEGVARKERAPRIPGYNRAMSYVLQRRDDPHFRFVPEVINALHFMINEDDQLAWPGRWRRGGAGVRDGDGAVVYRAPSAELIPGLMAELCEMLSCSGDVPPIARAATALLNILRIHPFRDGNGRLARCLYSLVMARAGYTAPALLSIEEYIGHHRVEYDDALSNTGGEWNPSLDTRAWLRFCLVAQYRQAVEFFGRFRRFAQLCVELKADMTESGVESGASVAASDLFRAPLDDEVASWPRLVDKEIESRARTEAPFRFVDNTPGELLQEDTGPLHCETAALLDESIFHAPVGEIDPFAILQRRRAPALDRSAS